MLKSTTLTIQTYFFIIIDYQYLKKSLLFSEIVRFVDNNLHICNYFHIHSLDLCILHI